MKISERGQITIPKPLRKRFGFDKNVEVEIIETQKGLLIRKGSRRKHPVDLVFGILKQPSDTDRYIEEVRGSWTFSFRIKDFLRNRRNSLNWLRTKGP